MVGLTVAIALIGALALALPGGAAASTTNCTINSQNGKLCLTLSDTPDPVAYSSLDGNKTYLHYKALLANSGGNSISHVGLTDTLPAGTGYVSSTTSKGTCSASGQTVSCTIGSLKTGQSANVDITVTAPATSDPNPPDITITNNGTAAFDEQFNDNPNNGGKVDTVSASESTRVSKSAGQTYVPQGASAQVESDPSQPQDSTVAVKNATSDLLASMSVLAPDNFCLLGQVTIQGNVYVCRNGGWFNASVTVVATGQTYTNSQNPLAFHLQWDKSLVSPLQTANNFVVFYQKTTSAPVQVFSNRCDAATPPSNMPCLQNVQQTADGGWSVDLVKPDNGHMR